MIDQVILSSGVAAYVFDVNDLNGYDLRGPVEPFHLNHADYYRQSMLIVQGFLPHFRRIGGYEYVSEDPYYTVTCPDHTYYGSFGWWWESINVAVDRSTH